MPSLPYTEIVRMMEETSAAYARAGEYVVRDVLPAPRVISFTNPRIFALVKITEDKGASKTYIEIAGGGGHNARPEPRLFYHLVTRGMDFDWGGPFAKHYSDEGSVTYGQRLLVPNDVIVSENIPNSIGYIYGMIDMVGGAARIIASEIVGETGGRLLEGADREDDIALMTAMMMRGTGGPTPRRAG